MSTLSTDIIAYQQLSTEALYIIYRTMKHILTGLATENYVNTVNRGQQGATAAQQSDV